MEITVPGAMPTTPYLQQEMFDHVTYLYPIMEHCSYLDCFFRNMHRFKVYILKENCAISNSDLQANKVVCYYLIFCSISA